MSEDNIRYGIAKLWFIGYSTSDIANLLDIDVECVFNLAIKMGLIKR